MISFSTSGGNLHAFAYNLESRFDYVGNTIAQAIAWPSQPYFLMAGSLRKYKPDTGAAISYTNTQGFVMMMTTSGGQFSQCLTFQNVQYTGSSVITTVQNPNNYNIVSSFNSIFTLSGSMTFSKSTSLSMVAMASPTHSSCTLLSTVTISTTNPSPVTFDLQTSQGSQNQQFQFSVGPSCYAFTTFSMTVSPFTPAVTLSPTDNSQQSSSSQTQVSWSSLIPVGAYTITVTGTLANGVSATATFQLTITNQCLGVTMTAPTIPLIPPYSLGQSRQNKVLTPFILSAPACTVTYTMTNGDGTALGPLFSFSSSSMKVYIGPTSSVGSIATYSLMLTGTIGLPTPVVGTYLISVTIQNQCTGIVCPSLLSTKVTYNIGGSAQSNTIDWSTLNPSCPTIGFLAPNINTTPLNIVNDATVAAMLSMAGNILTIQTADPSKIGIYSITITGQIVSATTITQPCTYTVVIACTVKSISPANTMTPQYYTIGQGQMQINIKQFVESPICSYPVTYSLTVSGFNSPPSFISSSFSTISGGSLVITSNSYSDYTKQTSYTINIVATIATQIPSPTTTLTFPLYLKVTNTGPPVFSPQLSTLTITAGQTSNLQFPAMVDPDPLDTPSLSKINLGTSSRFITGVFPNLVAFPGPSNVGSYSISVTLQDNNPNQLKATYTISIIVQPALQNQTADNSTALASEVIANYFGNIKIKGNSVEAANSIPIIPVIKSISSTGLVVVNFNTPILVPRNLSIVNQAVLKIDVIPSSRLTNTSLLGITQWNVTKFTSTQMIIQLVFANPLHISTGMSKDSLQITFVMNAFFINAKTMVSLTNSVKIAKVIPAQLDNGGATKSLQAMQGTASTAVTSIMVGSLAVNLIMAASLQMLWGMINVMQLVVNMPLLNVAFPANAVLFYNFIINISNFNIIPTQQMLSYFFTFTDSTAGASFQQMGISGTNIIVNLGSMIVYLVGFILIAAFVLLLGLLRKRFFFIKRVYETLSNTLFFNMILRMILEGYMQYALTAILNVMNLQWDNQSDSISSVIAITVLVGIFVYPFLVWYLVWKWRGRLNEDSQVNRFGCLYGELRIGERGPLMYNVLYMLRRLFFAVLAQTTTMTFVQVQAFVFHCILMISYVTLFKPFESPMMNKLEVFNEVSILLAAYHLFLFTNYVSSPELQYQLGWSLIGVTTFNILVNMVIMLSASIRKAKLSIIKYKYQLRLWLQKRRKARKGIYKIKITTNTENQGGQNSIKSESLEDNTVQERRPSLQQQVDYMEYLKTFEANHCDEEQQKHNENSKLAGINLGFMHAENSYITRNKRRSSIADIPNNYRLNLASLRAQEFEGTAGSINHLFNRSRKFSSQLHQLSQISQRNGDPLPPFEQMFSQFSSSHVAENNERRQKTLDAENAKKLHQQLSKINPVVINPNEYNSLFSLPPLSE